MGILALRLVVAPLEEEEREEHEERLLAREPGHDSRVSTPILRPSPHHHYKTVALQSYPRWYRRRTGLGGGGGLTNYTALLLCLPWWGAASPASRCCSQAGGVNIVRGTRAGADCGMTTG